MNEADVRRVLLVRAFEEERGGKRFLEPAELSAATREARVEAGGKLELFLLARANRLYASLREAVPGLDRLYDAAGLRGPGGVLVFVVMLVIGVLVDRAGGGRFLNLLAFPLIGMIAWNLAVYAAVVIGALRPHGDAEAPRRPRGWLTGPAAWVSAPERPWSRWHRVAESAGAAAHGQEFLSDWTTTAAPLYAARITRILHFGAAGLVLGAVGGMYLRGLVLEYRVGWESTFLDAAGVHRFLSVVLWPGLAAGVGELPSVDALAALRGAPESGASENAAQWIHLYAFTALALVLVPRAFLALLSSVRSARLERDLPLRWDLDPWAARQFAGDRGSAVEVRTLIYAHRMETRSSEGLRGFALDFFGNRAAVLEREELAYGDEYVARESERPERCELIVFNLAQTPESEVHGRFCRAAAEHATGARGKRAVLVIVDEASFTERLSDDDESRGRLEARRRNWSRVLGELDLDPVFLDLSDHVSNEALGRARGALWPAPLE
ncbi:MAG: DUF2868 domain-containing protein [Planctomycetes bacterium]|nr:DUF2868 domain-containing protein [Planctomycetota bacterium]